MSLSMKSLALVLCFILFVGGLFIFLKTTKSGGTVPTTYYVDATSGNDDASGLQERGNTNSNNCPDTFMEHVKKYHTDASAIKSR